MKINKDIEALQNIITIFKMNNNVIQNNTENMKTTLLISNTYVLKRSILMWE